MTHDHLPAGRRLQEAASDRRDLGHLPDVGPDAAQAVPHPRAADERAGQPGDAAGGVGEGVLDGWGPWSRTRSWTLMSSECVVDYISTLHAMISSDGSKVRVRVVRHDHAYANNLVHMCVQQADVQQQQGYLNFADFRRFVKGLKARPQLHQLHKKLAKHSGGVLTCFMSPPSPRTTLRPITTGVGR